MVLDEFCEAYLKELKQEFEESPTRNHFSAIVHPLIGQFDEKKGKWKPPPAVFLLSATQHLGISVMCPEHYVELKLGPWTDDLTTDGRRSNPRLVFCIGGNALLVKSVQSALSDLLTTSATHGTFSRPGTKRGLISIIKLMQFTIVRFF